MRLGVTRVDALSGFMNQNVVRVEEIMCLNGFTFLSEKALFIQNNSVCESCVGGTSLLVDAFPFGLSFPSFGEFSSMCS